MHRSWTDWPSRWSQYGLSKRRKVITEGHNVTFRKVSAINSFQLIYVEQSSSASSYVAHLLRVADGNKRWQHRKWQFKASVFQSVLQSQHLPEKFRSIVNITVPPTSFLFSMFASPQHVYLGKWWFWIVSRDLTCKSGSVAGCYVGAVDRNDNCQVSPLNFELTTYVFNAVRERRSFRYGYLVVTSCSVLYEH
jgi:hypothetical protein